MRSAHWTKIAPTVDVTTMEQRSADSIAGPRSDMEVLSGLSILAIILSLIGVYGVTSRVVEQKRREITIRKWERGANKPPV